MRVISSSRRIGRAGVTALAAVTLAAGALASSAAASAAPASGNGPSAAGVAQLKQQLRSGTISQSHGIASVCETHHLRCEARALSTSKTSTKPLVFEQPIGYGATELEKAYGLTKAPSTSGTIAILDAGAYPTLESDLTIYRDTYGLPRCTTSNGCLSIHDYKGGAPLQPSTDPFTQFVEENVAVETALDVQMASAACPKCKIVELQLPPLDAAPQDQAAEDTATEDFAIASRTAARLGAKAISISYGYDGDSYTNTGDPAKGLRRPGVAVFSSSGDDGLIGPDPETGEQPEQWPQSLPYVTSAGGTSLYTDKSVSRGYTETAWNSAGSGCSYSLPAANGQPASIAKICDGHRTASDVSAVADPYTGVAVYDSYAPASGMPAGFLVVGGTSASSPFLAGMYARAGVPANVLGPNTIYRAPASAFNDVTIGANAEPGQCESEGFEPQLCQSGAGWDGPTGVGTPKGLTPFTSAA